MSSNFLSQKFAALTGTALLISALFFSACEQEPSAPAPISQLFEINLGETSPQLQIALTQKEMSRGLMFRESMPENEGMLFYFNPPKQMGFWMRNTKIPLDIGFFDTNGVLKEVYHMYPMDERSVESRSNQLIIAIEMNKGWYAKNGVKPGAKLDLEKLRKAFEARGIEPRKIVF